MPNCRRRLVTRNLCDEDRGVRRADQRQSAPDSGGAAACADYALLTPGVVAMMSSVTVQAVDMTQPIRDAPRLFLADRAPGAGDAEPKEGHGFRYRARAHSELPHVMKFSGGRSSGMLHATAPLRPLPGAHPRQPERRVSRPFRRGSDRLRVRSDRHFHRLGLLLGYR